MAQDHTQPEHHDEVAQLAYSYWEERGYENGHDVEDWLRAEEEIARRRENESQRYERTAA